MPTTRFCALLGIPRRSYARWQARQRAGDIEAVKGPWPAPVRVLVEDAAAAKAEQWPAWGHRKIHALLAVDGEAASASTVARALRARDLLLPVAYQGERRQLARARKAAFATTPTAPVQVWQLDFSEYETATGGCWRIAGVADYHSKYEYGWHVSATANHRDAIAAVELALDEAQRLLGRSVLAHCTDPVTGELTPVTLVTDNGGPFRAARFHAFIAAHPELNHVRTRVRTPGQNGVRERGFGSLKYEHLYRHEITDGVQLAVETEAWRQIFNTVRPHEALAMRTPALVQQTAQQPQPPAST